MTNLRIAIIDDDSIFRFIFSKMVKKFPDVHTEVIGFEDGLLALNYFQANKEKSETWPDMLFVDINMPQMTGWEFMDEVCRLELDYVKNIPVFILSSSTSLADIEKINEYHFIDDYLVKPLKKTSFMELLHQYHHKTARVIEKPE
ncbi:response regulator [Flavobacterium sp. WV_118_3]|uniref:response regulator n=1 Tax=Flavobacterium sp. WV_118_3 TaxID=3151764 RepID=UPI0012C032C9|nr:response regulator [Flavobacterium sp.]HRB71607.1 response regulator [Flavobacterium sp.]